MESEIRQENEARINTIRSKRISITIAKISASSLRISQKTSFPSLTLRASNPIYREMADAHLPSLIFKSMFF